MKTKFRFLGLAAGCSLISLASPTGARAQNFYFNADAGVALADNVELRQFVFRTPHAEIKLDPGARVSVAGGYNFNDYLGAQLETGFIANEVKSVSGAGSIDASLGHVPMLADIVLRYDRPENRWMAFAGAGAGGDVSIIDLDHVRAGGFVVDGTGSDVVFAWQAFAGARYRLNDRMSIGGSYKFYSSSSATWDVENTRGDIRAGTARVHSFGVDFNWRF